MSEEKSDKILLFVMVGGSMLASEGDLTMFDDKEWAGRHFVAQRPDDGSFYLINLRNVLSINLVPRDAVVTGTQLVKPVSGRLQ
jgi:hypothetical protein